MGIIAAFIETCKNHRSSLCVRNIETSKAKPGESCIRQLGSTGLTSSEGNHLTPNRMIITEKVEETKPSAKTLIVRDRCCKLPPIPTPRRYCSIRILRLTAGCDLRSSCFLPLLGLYGPFGAAHLPV